MFTYILRTYAFDNEDFLVHLCGADENNMEYIYEKCEAVFESAVDGCFEMGFIQMRNQRSPRLRIDDKYYQFVMCDSALYQQFVSIVGPCLQQLPPSLSAFENLNEWLECLVDTVRQMESKIDNQKDPNKAFEDTGTKGGNKGKGGNGGKAQPNKKNPTKGKPNTKQNTKQNTKSSMKMKNN